MIANDDDVNDVDADQRQQQYTQHESLIHEEDRIPSMLWPTTNYHQNYQLPSDEHQNWESFDEEEDNHGDGSISAHNELDEVDQFPVDLSNDIAVNEMLADQGAAFNPDAEVFDVDDFAGELQRSSRMGGNYNAQLSEQHQQQQQQQYGHQKYDDERVDYKQEIKK